MEAAENYKENIILGNWSIDKINSALSECSKIKNASERIKVLSAMFLNTPYKEHTLVGGADISEIFTINLEAVDCFTFIDYVEAMRLSGDFTEFKEKLKRIRYRGGIVDYACRNHFFTDWTLNNGSSVRDITDIIGGSCTLKLTKNLNIKDDGSLWLQGIQASERAVTYISSKDIDFNIVNNLQTGDYIGIYSDKPGLDVSHVGILIKDGVNIYLRHASLKAGAVFDEDFLEYIAAKSGMVVLRPF